MHKITQIVDNEKTRAYDVYDSDVDDSFTFEVDKQTGESTRMHFSDGVDPFWNPLGPELLDICITTKCSRGCEHCYQSSTPDGTHMPIDLYRKCLEDVKHSCVQIAIGGGEPTEHPEFAEILRITNEEFGMIVNYTTNGDFLNHKPGHPEVEETAKEIISATKKYCGAVAISAHGDFSGDDENLGWMDKVDIFADFGIKTNIHWILGEDSIDEISGILNCYVSLRNPDLSAADAIIFLLYKPIGRATESGVLKSTEKIENFWRAVRLYDAMITPEMPSIGFDACCAPMIVDKTDFNTVYFDCCEGGRWSGYIEHDGQVKPCSFDKKIYPKIQNKPFIDIWKDDLEWFRSHQKSCECTCEEEKKQSCMGGCPYKKSIVICDHQGKKLQQSVT